MTRQTTSPADIATALRRAATAHSHGRLDEAEPLYRTVLTAEPKQFDALHMLGILMAQRGQFEEGLDLLERAMKSNPRAGDAQCNLARIQWSLGRREEALASVERALELAPHLTMAYNNRGVWLREMGRREEALESYDRALALASNNLDFIVNRATLLLDMRRPQEALAAFDKAIGYHGDYVDARIGRANALAQMQRFAEAMEELDRVLAAQPANVFALNNRGNLLDRSGRDEEALAAFNAAAEAQPNYAQTYLNRGNLMIRRGLYRHAAADFATALKIDGNCKYALGNFIHCRLQACDWAGFDAARTALAADIKAGKPAAVPFYSLGVVTSPADQLACARAFVADRHPPVGTAPRQAVRKDAGERIRIAYVSVDAGEGPMAAVAAGVFAAHDRGRFETTVISLAPEAPGPVLDRARAAVDRFVAVVGDTDAEVVARMRDLDIDIAIDLTGHRPGARPGIFAGRAAPIQVNWLGYPGTLGADYVDYIVADSTLIPADAQASFAEKVVCLPDGAIPAASGGEAAAWTRAAAGLPDTGLVFCAFGATRKRTPAAFAAWMRLLKAVPDSVLWLGEGNDAARENLAREANALGIEPSRLVFAPRLPRHEDHRARLALADIFLDTPDYNAHAAAVDALSAGVPVVTVLGRGFCARLGASLVSAAGAPELATHSLDDYEALALDLATDAALLARVKAKLAQGRAAQPLFDTARLVRHLEAAYAQMWDRHVRGEAPAPFSVARIV